MFYIKFALETMFLPAKLLGNADFDPAKIWSNADFALRNHRAIIPCPVKSQSHHTLPSKITEPSYLVLQKYGAMQTLPRNITETEVSGAKITTKYVLKLDFFSSFFSLVNQCYFKDLYNY